MEDKTTKKGRIRTWMDRNNIDNTDVALVTFYAVVLIGLGVATKKGIDNLKEEQAKINDWETEQKSQGREIVMDVYGRVLAVDNYEVY